MGREVKTDTVESGLTTDTIHNREDFKSRIIKAFEERPPKRRPKFVISEEQRKIRSERMQRFWYSKRSEA